MIVAEHAAAWVAPHTDRSTGSGLPCSPFDSMKRRVMHAVCEGVRVLALDRRS